VLSTVVKPDELDGFFVRYAEACKTGMSSLKKRDRKKGKKDKKKKKGAVETKA
jgi:signal recognition particle subunit SRP14